MSSEIDFENVNSSKSDSGIKLPYFHRVLSKEDTELIGNIAPQKISEPIIDSNEEKKLSSSSKWNSAGTWEERNCTDWSKEYIKSKFIALNYKNHEGLECIIHKVKDITGYANIASVRGKPKFLFEFEIQMEFEVNTANFNSYKGSLQLSDVQNDQIEDIEFKIEWDGTFKPPNQSYSQVKGILTQGEFKNQIIKCLIEYETDFRKL